MFADVDLRQLAEMSAAERIFLTVYLSGPRSVRSLPGRFERLRRLLRAGGERLGDERQHFDENVRLVEQHLERRPLESGGLCLVACWAEDLLRAVALPVPVADGVHVDSSPFIRPLAELQEEYENAAVVVADNARARIFLVSSAAAGDERRVRGDIKNRVKKGGWSQQRYERRRDGELLQYARDIVGRLAELEREADFRRLVLVGGKEILRIVHDELPEHLKRAAGSRAVDLGRGPDELEQEIWEQFSALERQSERDLWERIRGEALSGGLGCTGAEEVHAALQQGRVDTLLLARDHAAAGRRCRDCEQLALEPVAACPACGSSNLFAVDVANELVEMAEKTAAEVDFVDPTPELTAAGGLAALLRWS